MLFLKVRSLMYPSKVGISMLSRFNPMSKTVWSFSNRSEGPLENTLATFYNFINVQNSLFSISAPCERHVHPFTGDDLPLFMREQNTKGNKALRKSPLLNIHPRKVNRSGIHIWVLYVSLPILLIARRKRKDVSYALTRYRDKLYHVHEDFEDEHKFHANE